MRKKQKTRKWGKLAWIGLGVLIASPVLGTVSFALIASLVGEKKLEDASGQMTALGSLSMWLPAIVGAGLIVIDLVFKPTIKSAWQAVVAIGLAMSVVGLISIVLLDPNTAGANIGAGLLVIAGVFVVAIGTVLKLTKK